MANKKTLKIGNRLFDFYLIGLLFTIKYNTSKTAMVLSNATVVICVQSKLNSVTLWGPD